MTTEAIKALVGLQYSLEQSLDHAAREGRVYTFPVDLSHIKTILAAIEALKPIAEGTSMVIDSALLSDIRKIADQGGRRIETAMDACDSIVELIDMEERLGPAPSDSVKKPLKLHFDNDYLLKKIDEDGDYECGAGIAPSDGVNLLTKASEFAFANQPATEVPALSGEGAVEREAEANKAMSELIRFAVRKAMLDAWNDICADTGCHPLDIERTVRGGNLMFSPRHWADQTAAILERLTNEKFRALAALKEGE
jgi:hypothetical protein